ncbi:MAG: pyridine nucleotide-disulfide oxidoreductase [Propionibacteriaceae bacterium]|jgi:hypothetical protein|nr:pyridine nucleotide-disulfide oxidoreductase [Propionibacteriaceae bacterium]
MTISLDRVGPSESAVAVERRDPGGRPQRALTTPTPTAIKAPPAAPAPTPAPSRPSVTDDRGCPLSTTAEAAREYCQGVYAILGLRQGAFDHLAKSVELDPTFALGHAAKALMAHELCAPAVVPDELHLASLYAEKATEWERSHVFAVQSHIRGDKKALVRHVRRHPKDALLLNSIMPTILFGGAVEVPSEAWDVVESCAPAYSDDDWWFLGTLGFVRQEQLRFDESMDLALRSLAVEPAGGHAAHTRAHVHYETGDHKNGLDFMSNWVLGPGQGADPIDHNAWHAAVHELSLGDVEAVRRRYDAQLDPHKMTGCRALIDGGQLFFRWAITPGAGPAPDMAIIQEIMGHEALIHPVTPFHAYHAACVLTILEDDAGLKTLATWSAAHKNPVFREGIAPLADALHDLATHRPSVAADKLAAMTPQTRRLGGSDAQREIVEEARIAALLKAERYTEAVIVLESRLSRRHAPRDVAWKDWALAQHKTT